MRPAQGRAIRSQTDRQVEIPALLCAPLGALFFAFLRRQAERPGLALGPFVIGDAGRFARGGNGALAVFTPLL